MAHTVYAVASGKGGVGKTATTVNLGAALAERGHTVAIVDADLGMANLGGFLGLDPDGPTLHEVLAGDADLADAIYEIDEGLAAVPSGISLEGFADVETESLSEAIAGLRDSFDYVLLDLGAGLSHDTVLPLALADAVVLVSTPKPVALQDTAKTHQVTERLGGAVAGVVLTRAMDPQGLDVEAVSDRLGLPVLAVIPEDDAVDRSALAGVPVVATDPETPATEGFHGLAEIVIAESLANAPVVPETPDAAESADRSGEPSTGEPADEASAPSTGEPADGGSPPSTGGQTDEAPSGPAEDASREPAGGPSPGGEPTFGPADDPAADPAGPTGDAGVDASSGPPRDGTPGDPHEPTESTGTAAGEGPPASAGERPPDGPAESGPDARAPPGEGSAGAPGGSAGAPGGSAGAPGENPLAPQEGAGPAPTEDATPTDDGGAEHGEELAGMDVDVDTAAEEIAAAIEEEPAVDESEGSEVQFGTDATGDPAGTGTGNDVAPATGDDVASGAGDAAPRPNDDVAVGSHDDVSPGQNDVAPGRNDVAPRPNDAASGPNDVAPGPNDDVAPRPNEDVAPGAGGGAGEYGTASEDAGDQFAPGDRPAQDDRPAPDPASVDQDEPDAPFMVEGSEPEEDDDDDDSSGGLFSRLFG